MAPTTLPEQLVRTCRFTRGVPERFTISSDGGTVLFLRGRTGDDPAACLWALDVGSGRERLLADPVRLLANGRSPRTAGIEAYGTDAATGVVAFALAGGLWKLDVGKGASPTAGRRPRRGPPARSDRLSHRLRVARRPARGGGERLRGSPGGRTGHPSRGVRNRRTHGRHIPRRHPRALVVPEWRTTAVHPDRLHECPAVADGRAGRAAGDPHCPGRNPQPGRHPVALRARRPTGTGEVEPDGLRVRRGRRLGRRRTLGRRTVP